MTDDPQLLRRLQLSTQVRCYVLVHLLRGEELVFVDEGAHVGSAAECLRTHEVVSIAADLESGRVISR